MIALFSKTRFRKSALLLRQALAPLWSGLPGFLGGSSSSRLELIEPSVSTPVTWPGLTANDATSTDQSDAVLQPARTDSHPTAAAGYWQREYVATPTVSAEVLSLTRHRYTQDEFQPDQTTTSTVSLSTRFRYLGRVVPDALFMHNAVNQLAIFAPCLPVGSADATESRPVDSPIDTSNLSQSRANYQLLREFTYPFNNPRALGADVAVEAEHYAGTTLCLHSDIPSGSGNVFHWMIDGLPRVFLAEEAGFLSSVQQVLIPPDAPAFIAETLRHLGYRWEFVSVEPLQFARFESLICFSPPRGLDSNVVPGWVIDEYRKRVGVPAPENTTEQHRVRLFISRKDAGGRYLENEDELSAWLASLGFRTVILSKMGFREKVELFARADCVIGLTGAGMVNLLFCPQGTRVLELMPSSNVTYVYSTIASYLGLEYRPFIFQHHSLLSRINPYFGRFSVPIQKIKAEVVSLLGL